MLRPEKVDGPVTTYQGGVHKWKKLVSISPSLTRNLMSFTVRWVNYYSVSKRPLEQFMKKNRSRAQGREVCMKSWPGGGEKKKKKKKEKRKKREEEIFSKKDLSLWKEKTGGGIKDARMGRSFRDVGSLERRIKGAEKIPRIGSTG